MATTQDLTSRSKGSRVLQDLTCHSSALMVRKGLTNPSSASMPHIDLTNHNTVLMVLQDLTSRGHALMVLQDLTIQDSVLINHDLVYRPGSNSPRDTLPPHIDLNSQMPPSKINSKLQKTLNWLQTRLNLWILRTLESVLVNCLTKERPSQSQTIRSTLRT